VQCKRQLAGKLNEFLAPMQERRRELETNPGQLDEIMAAGNAKARAATQDTLGQVREAMHLNVFQTPSPASL
jgi:tryptophanyl-tRNA synthetase